MKTSVAKATVAAATFFLATLSISGHEKEHADEDKLEAHRTLSSQLAPYLASYVPLFLECERCVPDCTGWKQEATADCSTLELLKMELGNKMYELGIERLRGSSTFIAYGRTIMLVERAFESDEQLLEWRKSRANFDMHRGLFEDLRLGQTVPDPQAQGYISSSDEFLFVGTPIVDEEGYLAAWYVLYPHPSNGASDSTRPRNNIKGAEAESSTRQTTPPHP